MTAIAVGDNVAFREPLPDEYNGGASPTMRVVELRGPRVLVEYQIDHMTIKPTASWLADDLCRVD